MLYKKIVKSGRWTVSNGQKNGNRFFFCSLLTVHCLLLHVFFLCSLFTVHCALSFAAFRDAGWGVRPEGMGGAFVAVANDANAILYNPAGTLLINKSEISFAYTRPYVGLDSNAGLGMFYTAYARKVNPYWCFGLGWTNFNSQSLKENSLALNLALSGGKNLSFGANVKRMSRSFQCDQKSANDPVFAGGTDKTVYAVDLGLYGTPLSNHLPGLSVGLALKNINEPNAGLRTEETVPLEACGGLAYKTNFYLLTFEAYRRNGLTSYRSGCESALLGSKIRLRAGGSTSNGSMGFSYHHTAGKSTLVLDYAFIMPFLVSETGGTHRISFSIRH